MEALTAVTRANWLLSISAAEEAAPNTGALSLTGNVDYVTSYVFRGYEREDTGLIMIIGDWVFRTATEQAASWQRKYDPQFQVSVNISPVM